MIPLLLALVAQTAILDDEQAYRSCAALVRAEPERAVEIANEWRIRGGGLYARQCLGQAYAALERWEAAAATFEQAAREAETLQDVRRADFWVQSGNASLAADKPSVALKAFDAALATTALTPELRGEVHLDRARALVALDDLKGARTDLDKGLELVPSDPFGWYLSAGLAMREQDAARAEGDIAKAVTLAPDDARILLLAGNIAAQTGDPAQAKAYYARAASAAPNSEAGRTAGALALGEVPAEAPPVAAPPAP